MLISSTNKTIRFLRSVVNDKSLVFTYNADSQYASITRYHDV